MSDRTELSPKAQSATSIAETARVPAYQGPPGERRSSSSGQHRALQLEQIERARRDASLAPTFDKLIEVTLGITASNELLQREVKRLVKAMYVTLVVVAVSEAASLLSLIHRT